MYFSDLMSYVQSCHVNKMRPRNASGLRFKGLLDHQGKYELHYRASKIINIYMCNRQITQLHGQDNLHKHIHEAL